MAESKENKNIMKDGQEKLYDINDFQQELDLLTSPHLKKQMNREKIVECFLQEKQRQIIKNQNEKLKNYTEQQKIEIFQEQLKKLQNTIKQNVKYSRQYERIEEDYNLILQTSKSSMKGLCLPKQKLEVSQKILINLTIQKTMERILKEIIYKKSSEDVSHFMTFTDEKYTNILKGSLSDAKLKYFDARKYFVKEKKHSLFFYVSRSDLRQCIKFDELFENTSRQFLKKMKQYEVKNLKNIFEQINNVIDCLDLKLKYFNDFQSVYESIKSGFLPRCLQFFKKNLCIQKKIYKPEKLSSTTANHSCQIGREDMHKNQNNRAEFYSSYSRQKNSNHYQDTQIDKEDIYKYDNSKEEHDSQYTSKKITNHYIQIDRKDIYKYDNGKEELHQLDFIEEKITDSIKWSVIQQEQKKISCKQKNCMEILKSLLQRDLLKLNLSVSSIFEQQVQQKQIHKRKSKKNSYQKKKQKLKFLITEKISTDRQQFCFDHLQTFLKQLGHLKFINTKKLKEKIKPCPEFPQDWSQLFIGKQEVIEIKETKPEFKGYLDNDYQSISQRFRQESFKVFAFQQIKKNQGLQLFFGTIFNMAKEVKQKWGSFESKAIKELYNKVNEEISVFNNDLNQISYKLNLIFIGKVHLLITYLIWKYQTDSLKQKQSQLLKNILKSRQHQLKKFLDRTSNYLNQIIDQQVQSFLQILVQAYQQIIKEEKKIYMHKQKVEFFQDNTRENIQNELDIQIYSRITEKNKILQYVQKPAEVIEKKYQQKSEAAWYHMVQKFESNKLYEKLPLDMKSSIQSLVQVLQNEKISEENGSPYDLFQIIGVANNVDYDEEAKVTLFSYVLDVLRDHEPNKKRQCSDVLLKPKIQLRNTKHLSDFSKKVLQKVNSAHLKITNLSKFLKKSLVQVNQQQLKKTLEKSFQFKDEEKKQFKNSTRVVICKEKCPGCARICGVEGSHTFHKCIYGHQMRILGGYYIQKSNGKKQALVSRCEQLDETYIMQVNGKKMTWAQFKNYQRQKPTGGWLYDDAKDNFYPQNKKKIQEAWRIIGPIICKQKEIQYVPSNEARKQIQNFNQKAHFIFALDDSGSMSGDCWNDLMKVVEETINKIKQYEKSGSEVKISVLNFSQNTHLYYERYSPNQINISSIHYRGGLTEFQQPFELAYKIAQKTIHQEAIVFIFMTDGCANYPQRGVQKFQQLSSRYPKNFIYLGIPFGSNSDVMKNINLALDGKNIFASSFEQLLKAYMSSVEMIPFQEEKMMP